jgi:hypothetical protein
MTEHELRALVREAIKRHLSGTAGPNTPSVPQRHSHAIQPPAVHASHATFLVPDGSAGDGPCIIEPSVMCTHCGYCKSYGH